MSLLGYPAGSLVISEIQLGLFNWVFSRVNTFMPNCRIIWRNQSEPLPARPCVTLKLIAGPTGVGYSDSETFTGTIDPMTGLATSTTINVGGHRSMTLSVQVFGNSKVHNPMAYQLALDLNSSLRLPTVKQTLRAAGIAIWEQGSPTNLTALEETEFEERAGFDVIIGVAQNVTDDPGVIEHVGAIAHTFNE